MSEQENTGQEIPVHQDSEAKAPELTLSEEELTALCKSHVCPHCQV
ncbi:MAG TPA: nucleotide exchange factor GrpE, partial [Desulfovibrio sp.]|nr:nucleotide exchange factor GrpE [Desulfovibrio sp.]